MNYKMSVLFTEVKCKSTTELLLVIFKMLWKCTSKQLNHSTVPKKLAPATALSARDSAYVKREETSMNKYQPSAEFLVN